MKRLLLGLIGAAALLAPEMTDACSRILYHGEGDLRIVGRSLDWKTPIPTNLYVYPRGMKKQGNSMEGSVEWTS